MMRAVTESASASSPAGSPARPPEERDPDQESGSPDRSLATAFLWEPAPPSGGEPTRLRLWRYGLALLAVAGGAALRHSITFYFGDTPTYITFYPAVMLTALLAGLGPGLLATFVSALWVSFFVLGPAHLGAEHIGETIGLPVFTLMGVAISLLVHGLALNRARALGAASRSARYARSLLEASPDPLVTINPHGKITDVNNAAELATGLPRRGLIGTKFCSYFTEPEKANAGYLQALQRGRIANYPLSMRHASGKVTDVLYNASVYRDEQGAVAGVFAAARDVTERKRAEEALRASEAHYRGFIERNPAGVVRKTTEGRMLLCNDALVRMLGYGSREELLGARATELYLNAADHDVLLELLQKRRMVQNHEIPLKRKDGSPLWVLCSMAAVEQADGTVLEATYIDIHDRKRAEEAVRQSARYTRSLIEASLDPLVTISPEGKITDVNHATELVTGLPRQDLIGTDFAGYFTDPEKAHAGYRQVLEQGQVTDYPLSIRHVSGKVTDVLYNASVYRDEQGAVAGVFAAARDVTEQKRAQAELVQYRQHLEELVAARTAELQISNRLLADTNRELETFAYSVSHDLRTPLRAVDGFSRLLLEEYAARLDAEGQRMLQVIRDSSQKLARLIEDILDFSRVGRQEMARGLMDMNALVQAALKDLEPALAGREIQWQVQALPGAHGDARMIQRVWMNLLDNAIKFTGSRASARIQVGAQAAPNETVYFVQDNGVGFDAQYAHKLFGVFQRLHGEGEFAGTGIGLAVVQRIVARHGGHVWAEGTVNEGATFYFALPRREVNHGRSE